TNADVGSIQVNVTATDGSLATASSAFVLTVANVNDAPTVAHALTNHPATQDQAFSLTVPANSFADVDVGDTLGYTATLADGSALPVWLSFDASTASFSGTPTNADVSSIQVNVTATDGSLATASVPFVLTVLEGVQPPTITSPASLTVAENTRTGLVIHTVTATQPNHDALSYALTGEDASLLLIDAETGAVSLKQSPDYERQSTYRFDAVVTDSQNGSHVSQTVTLNVLDDPNENRLIQVDPYTSFNAAAFNPTLLNLTDPLNTPGGRFDVSLIALPANGTLSDRNGTPLKVGDTLDATTLGSLNYTPAAHFSGLAGRLVYRVETDTVSADRNVDIEVRPVTYLQLLAQNAVGLEGSNGDSTPFTFTVQRDGDLQTPITVSWQVESSGTLDRADFTGNRLPSGQVSFAAGESSQTLTVPVLADSLKEDTETFTVRLTEAQADSSTIPQGFHIQTLIPTAQGTIQDDDAPLLITQVEPLNTGKGAGQSLYGVGDTLQIAVHFNRPVTAGTDAGLNLTLDNRTDGTHLDPHSHTAVLIGGSGTDTLIFAYTLSASDANTSGIKIDGGLTGGAITDALGNTAPVRFDPITWTQPQINVLDGVAVDGYLAGASVYADTNDNRIMDAEEARTTSTDLGAYQLIASQGILRLDGGTDIAAQTAFTGSLSAPAGATVISPLTTLLVELNAAGSTAAALKTALGLETSIDLAHYDPIVEATRSLVPLDGLLTGLKTQAVLTQVADLVVLGSNALSNATVSAVDAGQALYKALSDYIVAHPGAQVDLTDSNAVTTLLQTAASDLGVTTDQTLSNTIQAIASSNSQLDQAAHARVADQLEVYAQLTVMAEIQALAKTHDLTALTANTLDVATVGTVAPVRLMLLPQTPDQSEGQSGTTSYIFTAIRSGDPRQPLTVDYTVGGDAHISVDDFGGQLPHGTLSFAAGEIIKPFTIAVSGDTQNEPDETFTVSLAHASVPSVMEIATAQSLIRNDDPANLQIGLPGLV
ncbi:MAG: putative Ig domain-containing protein, partial [Methylococcaceae bacterium]